MTTMVTEQRHDTLASLAQQLVAQQETKRDYLVDTRRMSITTTDDGDSTLSWDVPHGAALLDDSETPGVAGGIVNDHAHGQIAQRLSIPKPYYNRMRSTAPALLDANIVHWFYNAPERRMIRMLDGRVRAFMSDRYRRLDNIDLMEQAVVPVLQRFDGDLVFHVAALTDTKLHVRALLPRLRGEVKVGDVVTAGVAITNSEVGVGRLSVAPFLMRLACMNGMVIADRSLSKYHVGRQADDEAYALFQDDTLAADDAAFFLKARDAVTAALDDVTFGQIVEQLRASATGEPIVNPVAATEQLGQRFSLNEGEQGSVLRLLAEGGDLTQWGAANALTAAAKEADTFDRQAELEAAGWELATASVREWHTIAA